MSLQAKAPYPPLKNSESKRCPRVAIGICTYNRSESLCRLLKTVEKINYPNFFVIVVDNNSTDNTADIVRQFKNVQYILETRQGIGFARNAALAACDDTVDYLGFLDDDETVGENWINALLHCFSLDKRIVAAGGPYLPVYEAEKKPWMPDNFFAYRKDLKGCRIYDKITFPGGNNMLDLRVVKARGIKFDTTLSYCGKILLPGEDNDFFDKLIGEGDKCAFTEFAPVCHYIDAGKLSFAWLVRRYFFEGVTQYYRFGIKEWLHNIVQLPLKILALLLQLLSFNSAKIGVRLFKLIVCAGVCTAPYILRKHKTS